MDTLTNQSFTAYVGIDWADKHNINIFLVKKNTAQSSCRRGVLLMKCDVKNSEHSPSGYLLRERRLHYSNPS